MPEIKRCVLCKRPRSRAIQEQVSQKQTCPDYNCHFRNEILSKIQEAFKKYIATLFTLTGTPEAQAKADAETVFQLEKKLA